MRRMLINAHNPEEVRIAIVDGQSLDGYQVEVSEHGLTRGNIYRGLIANIQPALNAAFIEYGADRHGFLAIQDVVPEATYRKPKGNGRPRIEEVLEKNKPIVVQVTKEAEGQKGAVLTTNLSLAGRYLVLTPFDDTVGVSRKVQDDETRARLKEAVSKLELPKGIGVIVRTNALDQTKATLSRDLAALLRVWKRIGSEAREGKGPRLLYSDQDLVLQALRDHLDSGIGEVVVDDDAAHDKAEAYMRAFMPRSKTSLVRYRERVPLFSKYDLERQIDRIYDRRVELPSGGSIVIDRTEALVAIDVNSGRSTGAASQEETAVKTNVEAAREVARQLRMRDLGGLVVVDFIDMRKRGNQAKVEKVLRDAMKEDRARTTVGRISPNGLLEINRQRIQQALSMRTHLPCPGCAGTGRLASTELVGLNLLRRIEARAATGKLQKVKVHLHTEVADSLQNLRRREIAGLEREFDVRIEIVSANWQYRSEQKIEWIDRDPSEVAAREEAARATPRAEAAARPAAEEPHPAARSVPAAEDATTATASVLMEATDESGDDEAEEGREEAAASAGGRRPRRRRRGRRRKSGSNGEAAERTAAPPEGESNAANGAEAAPARSPEGSEEGDGAGGDEATGGGRSRSRRGRGGRRRGRAAGRAEGAAAPEGERPVAAAGNSLVGES